MKQRTRLKGTLTHDQKIKLGLVERGHAFRNYYTISKEKKQALLDRINQELTPQSHKRKGGSEKQKNHDRMMLAIFANALYQRYLGGAVHYSRSNDYWNKKQRKIPGWFPSGGPKAEIDRWVDADLLEPNIAKASSAATEQSEFKAKDKLIAIADELEIDLGDVFEAREERPKLKMKIKAKKGEKYILEYDQHQEPYASINADVDCYNDFIARFEITAPNNGVRFRMNCNSVFPVFNNADLTLGGRYFGAIYQQVKSEIRGFIQINDEETVELDLSACFGRMLYHMIGEDCDGDPYAAARAMDYLFSLGFDYEDARNILKHAFQLLVNCGSNVEAANSLKDHCIKYNLDYSQCFRIVQALFDYHPNIQHLFFKDMGTKLMYIESQIARDIMMKGVEQDICVLVIHDSFIVQKKHEEWLRETMLVTYYKYLSFLPVIK